MTAPDPLPIQVVELVLRVDGFAHETPIASFVIDRSHDAQTQLGVELHLLADRLLDHAERKAVGGR